MVKTRLLKRMECEIQATVYGARPKIGTSLTEAEVALRMGCSL